MTVRPITAPSELPVSLDALKAHLINSAEDQSGDIASKLDAAISFITGELDRPLLTSTWEICLDVWPVPFAYLLFNTQSVVSVKYVDAAGAEHTVDPATYKLDRAYDPAKGGDSDAGAARLWLASGKSWPSGPLDVGEAITVRLVAGWADEASVPAAIKNSILMVATHLLRDRSAVIADRGVVSEEIALGVQRLTATYQDRRW